MKEDITHSNARVLPITAEQLRSVGLQDMVYVKADLFRGKQTFMIYGADGEPIERVSDTETAAGMAAEYGFRLVPLQ